MLTKSKACVNIDRLETRSKRRVDAVVEIGIALGMKNWTAGGLVQF